MARGFTRNMVRKTVTRLHHASHLEDLPPISLRAAIAELLATTLFVYIGKTYMIRLYFLARPAQFRCWLRPPPGCVWGSPKGSAPTGGRGKVASEMHSGWRFHMTRLRTLPVLQVAAPLPPSALWPPPPPPFSGETFTSPRRSPATPAPKTSSCSTTASRSTLAGEYAPRWPLASRSPQSRSPQPTFQAGS
jgi:hypothetical protein